MEDITINTAKKHKCALTISASSNYLRCAITHPQPANTIYTIHYFFVGFHSVDWLVRHLQIPVENGINNKKVRASFHSDA